MREQVERLTAAAKLLVEAVIEGITEDELKTAQEALQRGDREPDQIILDLDALYEAIDQVTTNNGKES